MLILQVDYREKWFFKYTSEQRLQEQRQEELKKEELEPQESQTSQDPQEQELPQTQKMQKQEQQEIFTANINGVTVSFCIKRLDVGDFVFVERLEECIDKPVLVIERKTISDLCSSIIDGRFRQQKDRLNDLACRVAYIIEGSKNIARGLSKTTIDGALVNLIFKHNYSVVTTQTEKDTLEHLVLLYKKIQSGDLTMTNAQQSLQVPPTQLSKKHKVTENIMALQLSIIPGVSYATALKIAKEYPNMNVLLSKYATLNDEKMRETLLVDIAISDKRRLGVALSKKIYYALTE